MPVAALLAWAAQAVGGIAVTATVAFHLGDPRLVEASGIAVGERSSGIVYAQNDSGDTNRVFALDARTGRTAAVVTVAGAVNRDWEDIATAPDAAGTPSLWIGDIGDNAADRTQVQVYRVDEPQVRASWRDRPLSTARADVWRVRYPDGPADAEGLAVTPDGTPLIVTKSVYGRSVVYRLPRTPDAARVRTAVRVGTVSLGATRTPNPFGVVGTLTVTGAALSPDGSVFVVRTYADAWLWHVDAGGAGGLAAALRTRPHRIALPRQPQGEGVTVDGSRLLVDSEGAGTAVWSVPLATGPSAAASSSSSASSSSASSASAPSASGPSDSGDRSRASQPTLPSRRTWALAVLGTVLVAGIAAWIVRRRG